MKKLFVFSFIGIIIIVILNLLSIRYSSKYKDSASLLGQEKREAVREGVFSYVKEKNNILFLGSSDLMTGIIPELFDSLSGDKTYSLNLALPALPIGPNYFTLIDYLDNNPAPEYLVLTLTLDDHPEILFAKNGTQGINFPREVLSYFVYKKDKDVVLNYLLPCHLYMGEMIRYSFNEILHVLSQKDKHMVINKGEAISIIDQMIIDRGFYSISNQGKNDSLFMPENYIDSTDNNEELRTYGNFGDPYLKKFLNLTKEREIKVLLVNYPVRKNRFKEIEAIHPEIQKILDNNSHIRFSEEGWKSKIYKNKYFADPKHLNMSGAEKYTREIYDELLNTFEL